MADLLNYYASKLEDVKSNGQKDMGYTYANPGFRPGKPLHDMIVQEVNACMLVSKSHMQTRYDSMAATDELMTSFVSLSDLEKRKKQGNPRAPIADVVPVSYAIGQTLHTQCVSLLASQDSLYQLEPGGPEDVIGAAAAERYLQRQAIYFKHLDALSIQYWDNIKYGFGAVMPCWETKSGFTTVTQPKMQVDPLTGQQIPTQEMERVRKSITLYEGNNVRNLDPYRYFPDPNVALNRTQDGEFEAFTAGMTRFKLLEAEALDPTRWMNAKYIADIWGENKPVRSVMESCYQVEACEVGIAGKRRTIGQTPSYSEMLGGNNVEVSFLIRTVIPSEWRASDGTKLGKETVPVKYLFGVAGDSLLIACHPLDLDHDMFPGCVMATESDGYSCIARSPLEVTRPMMEAINYIYNLHMAFLRRFYKGRFAGDPTKFDVRAFLKGADFIPTTRLAFGTKINDVLQPIPVPNVTQGYTADITTLLEMIQRATGATDPVLGMLSQGERKSATEAQGVLKNALGRMEKVVLLGSVQSHQDLTYKLLSQSQQFMTKEVYVRMAGRYEDELIKEYAKMASAPGSGYAQDSRGFFPVSPDTIDVWADVVPLLPNKRGEQSFDAWVTLLPTMTAIPGANVQAMAKHVARLGGVRNVQDFFFDMPPAQVMTDEQLMQQRQAGNVIPAQQAGIPAPKAPPNAPLPT